mmetsp:Transcript_17480/g.34540  ORF Transcript_17480/g.34540 Transcript_17480/m.34540 type:complete len:421 (-) Transcript_17480:487-1749(-)
MADWRPVFAAAEENAVDALARLEANGFSLALADPVHGCSPLYTASWHGCLESATFLLSTPEGASSVNTPNAEGATPAYAAALRGNLAMLRLLHSEGADVSKSDNQGVSPLHAAVFEHYIDILNFLMGVEDVIRQLNEPDDSGISVLWVAVQRGDEESISILSSNGASRGDLPPASSRQWSPPEHRPPSIGGQREEEPETNDNGENGVENAPLPKIKGALVVDASTFARAAAEGDLDELLRMAAVGENMDASDDLGRTPLRLACEANHSKCVKFLVSRGSNKEARDHATGATPLHAAALRGHTPTVSVLLESGADVTSRRGEDGATPLWLACDGGYIGTVAVLLAHPNCDPDAKTDDGVRPIECACTKNHTRVADLLLTKGVSSFVDPKLWMGLRFGAWMVSLLTSRLSLGFSLFVLCCRA